MEVRLSSCWFCCQNPTRLGSGVAVPPWLDPYLKYLDVSWCDFQVIVLIFTFFTWSVFSCTFCVCPSPLSYCTTVICNMTMNKLYIYIYSRGLVVYQPKSFHDRTRITHKTIVIYLNWVNSGVTSLQLNRHVANIFYLTSTWLVYRGIEWRVVRSFCWNDFRFLFS